MAKKRLYKIAKELGLETSVLIGALKENGISVVNHSSSIEENEVLELLKEFIVDYKEKNPGHTPKSKPKKTQKQQSYTNFGTGPILIKKYGNRRLYSTAESRYLTLEDVEKLIRNGKEVKVIDAGNGADLTSQILLQILQESGKAQNLPVNFLQEIIRLRDDTVKSFFGRYFSSGIEMFMMAQQEMQRYMPNINNYSGGFGMWPFGGFGNNMPGMFNQQQGQPPVPPQTPTPMQPIPPPEVYEPEPEPELQPPDHDSDVQSLKQRLEMLENLLLQSAAQNSNLKRSKKPKKK